MRSFDNLALRVTETNMDEQLTGCAQLWCVFFLLFFFDQRFCISLSASQGDGGGWDHATVVVVLAVVLGVAAVATSGRWLFRPLQRGDWVQPYPGAYFGGKGTFYKPKGPDKFKGMFTQTASLSAIANSRDPRICARAWMDAVAARCCPLLPSADVRAAGDVIALQGVYARRAVLPSKRASSNAPERC